MRLFRRFAAVLLTVVVVAACGDDASSEFGEANSIKLSNGALIPETEDVQHEPVEGSISDLGFASLVGDGQDTFASHLDKPLVVNFFAAWCGPCRAELPEFETVYRELKDQVNFLGISRDGSAAPSLELLADTGVSYPSGWDSNGSLFGDLGLIAMPSTLMVDRDGVVVEQWAGVLTTEGLRDLITENLF
ncbi:MAG: TlpA family protein disulfide reductase [Acidimicrobiaceae bacterium]|nr:TlpA disulfide reductase family protein [Acidimicrobiaceae bacterium]MXW62842.1 TlpA family protein disulfide reductase [Acidimicrobiaceae bacterium]MYA74695.1 TlpA family protein disulfide reductase [Acidimicrobiaceae bacterium]MYC42832.1 TlpA family protein disulfide reductase [Acidimicrobiaceae bacterium]MYG54463.1 TlpA family protein disulfide reductase [Acidimicrobiaceae bacterium]